MRPCYHFFSIVLLAAAACGPKTIYTNDDVARLPKRADIMWSQAQAMDPQFKKLGAATYSDEDYAGFATAAGRLKVTTPRLREEAFSKGAEWNQIVDQLATHAADLDGAATAKDAVKAKAALAAIKATCKTCHSKFR